MESNTVKQFMVDNNKAINKLTNPQLRSLLKALNRPDDKELPTKKAGMMVFYEGWKDRAYL